MGTKIGALRRKQLIDEGIHFFQRELITGFNRGFT